MTVTDSPSSQQAAGVLASIGADARDPRDELASTLIPLDAGVELSTKH